MKPGTDSGIPPSERTEETAVRWFARQQSGAWTDSDQAQLDAWLEAATAHRVHYLRVTLAWEQSSRMKALGAGVPQGVIPPRDSWGDTRFPGGGSLPETAPCSEQADVKPAAAKTRFGLRLYSAAAAAIALLVGAAYVIHTGVFEGTRYSTPVGGIDSVTLTDGSLITLNTDTRIRVTLDEQERRIRLDQGEVFFEVAKDKLRPFVVYVGDKRVVAVGTKFSVRRDQDDLQVVVTEGRVRLATATQDAGSEGGLAWRMGEIVGADLQHAQRQEISVPPVTFLDAGAIARTSSSEVIVRPDATAEAEKLLSWRIGYVSFDNVTLADAVAEFNRYNARKIVIDDPSIATVLIGGNFRSNNTDAFLDLLQSGFPIAAEQRGDEVILKAR